MRYRRRIRRYASKRFSRARPMRRRRSMRRRVVRPWRAGRRF